MRQLSWSLLLWLCACGTVAGTKPDAQAEADACVAETDMAFCARLGNACESRTSADNCGMQRTVDCGTCAGAMGCVVGTCKMPVCSSFTYTQAALPMFSRAGIEDSIGSATPSGQVILYIMTPDDAVCQSFELVVADETAPGSGTYTQRNVTADFNAKGLYTGQNGHTITADGLTIITNSTDRKRWVSTKRSAINMTDFGAPSTADFDAINGQIATNAGTFSAPVISADGLQFIYLIGNVDTATNGIYSSVRASTTVPFPAGTKMPPPVQDYPFASGMSSDRLALFLFDNYSGRVLTRKSTSLPFTNRNAPAPPPQLAGWQHTPLADCSKVLAMTSPGGCQNEDVILLTRQ
ncbi:MAG: hypothetical protein H0T46_33010 [Deltaproteobacteria bacterium]|nr:hypothetical protein [Deltaproteobacteria bacterium]